MKIGDKVRFLSTTGGGRIAGFQKGGIVLVEDEDGFEIPTAMNDVVVVEADNYDMQRMVSQKMQAQEEAEQRREAGLMSDGRSVKAMMADGQAELEAFEEPDIDPADRPITFRQPAVERKGGNRLSAYLAFVPQDIDAQDPTFETYLVNDSNYTLFFAYSSCESTAHQLRFAGEVEPNTKLFVERFTRKDLGALGRVAVQLVAFKRQQTYLLKPAVDVQLRVDPVKFYKLTAFQPNDFFAQPAMLFTLVENDEVARPLVVDAQRLKQQMYKDEPTVTDKRRSQRTKDDGTLVVDLHADELLETTQGMNSADILHYQLDTVRRVMDENRKNHGRHIVFIHGKGEGVLRQAVLHELSYRYKQCRTQDASFQEYGFGACDVTIA